MARSVRLNWIAILVAAVALWPAYPAAAGPAFGAQGSRFLVDGEPRFLLFVSYFDGLQRPADVRPADLAWLKARGVDGVRVWPNWSPPRLMDADGRVSGSRMRDLSAFVDAAARAGLIVDVTFNREGVCASRQPCELTIPEYRDAITSVVGALQPHTNVLFDLQNEWNTYGEGITIEALTAIRDAVGAVDPSAIVTASTDSHYGEARAAAHAFDVLAFHNPRDAGGAWAHGSADLVKRLRGHLERGFADDTDLPAGAEPVSNGGRSVQGAGQHARSLRRFRHWWEARRSRRLDFPHGGGLRPEGADAVCGSAFAGGKGRHRTSRART